MNSKHALIKILTLLCVACAAVSCDFSKNKSAEVQSEEKDSNHDAVTFEYIAHASFILSYEGTRILLDPFADSVWLSYTFPKNIKAEAIFSTHPHYDHDGGIFRNLKPYWEGTLPFYQDPGTYNVGPFNISGYAGKHCEPYGKEFGQRNTIFVFEVGGLRICHWGDNGPIDETMIANLQNLDILMLPIDDTFHILSEAETAEVLEQLKPKIVIPLHYKIASLEPTPGKPKNLGTIDQYIQDHQNISLVKGNTKVFDRSIIPKDLTYYVFEHSKEVGR